MNMYLILKYKSTGEKLMNQKKYEEAIVYFDKAIEMDQKDLNNFNKKGKALNKLNKYEDEIQLRKEDDEQVDSRTTHWTHPCATDEA